MIEPDKREMLWYDVISIFNLDSDMKPHYFTMLFDKFKLLFGKEETKPYCIQCLSSSCVKKEKDGKEDEFYICNNELKEDNDIEHEIIIMTPNDLLNSLIKEVEELCTEPNSRPMELYDIERHIFLKRMDSYFETKTGEVRKVDILKKMYIIKRFIMNELIEIREKIKFTSYQIPSLKFAGDTI